MASSLSSSSGPVALPGRARPLVSEGKVLASSERAQAASKIRARVQTALRIVGDPPGHGPKACALWLQWPADPRAKPGCADRKGKGPREKRPPAKDQRTKSVTSGVKLPATSIWKSAILS